VTSLLQTAARVRDRGDLPRARALLRALAAQAPGDWQVWQALADVAESDAERLDALQHLAALAEPPAPSVTRPLPEVHGPQALPTIDAATRATPSAPPADQPRRDLAPPADPVWEAPRVSTAEDSAPPPGWFRSHWLTYAFGALIVLLLIGVLLVARDRLPTTGAQPTPTPPLPGVGVGVPATAAPSLPTAVLLPTAQPTNAPAGTLDPAIPTAAPSLPTAVLLPTAPPTNAPAGTPNPTIPTAAPVGPALAPGQVVQDGAWSITVLRPEHLLPLDGSIGATAPRGRFVLALLAVSNGGPSPARLPAERLVLTDSRGNRYTPAPGASSAYLAAFQRGVRGDLSLDEEIPAGAGIVSVPVIFDVPTDAAGVALRVGDAAAGWPVGR
jgi:hypothetical protein